MAAVRILGIDPGTIVAGFACLEVQAREPSRAVRAAGSELLAARASNLVRRSAPSGDARLIEAGVLRLGKGRPIEQRLADLARGIEELIARLSPSELALEEAFHGKSPQAALRIGEARGVVLAMAHRHGLSVHQFPPATIKRRVTGSGRAEKEVVAEMALRALGAGPIDGPADAGDAVAVALCRAEERHSPLADLTASR
ncbi:MAG: crossover junction endodeoxyribonuclease RuvC [Planctomycetota bacterium]